MGELLSIDEVVARYKGTIKKGTLANWRSENKGPDYVKLQGRIMYPLEKIQEWEARGLKTHA